MTSAAPDLRPRRDRPGIAAAGCRRGRAATGARAPRLRGLRGAAGHAHPAGRLPPRAPRCRPSGSSPNGSQSPGPPCARRWPRCVRPDWCRPLAGVVAARWSRCGPSTPSARAASRRTRCPARGLERRPRLPSHRRARRGSAGRGHAARRQAEPAPAGGARLGRQGPRAGRAPAGRLALPPDHRRAHRLLADDRVGDLRPGRRCTRCSARSRCSTRTSRTPTPSTRGSSKADPRGAVRSVRSQVMEEHCDDTAALLRGLLG